MNGSGGGWLANPVVRGMLLFSAFRAVYGTGILAVTWLLATSGEAPWWTSILFLAFSMVFSRLLLRGIKARWPGLWNTSAEKQNEAVTAR